MKTAVDFAASKSWTRGQQRCDSLLEGPKKLMIKKTSQFFDKIVSLSLTTFLQTAEAFGFFDLPDVSSEKVNWNCQKHRGKSLHTELNTWTLNVESQPSTFIILRRILKIMKAKPSSQMVHFRHVLAGVCQLRSRCSFTFLNVKFFFTKL